MATSTTIIVNSHWWGEHIQCELIVTRITAREVSYSAVGRPFAGTIPQWKFLDDFKPMPVQKKKGR